jgi:hypothetical protein
MATATATATTTASHTATATVYHDGRIAHLSSFAYHATIVRFLFHSTGLINQPVIVCAAFSAIAVFALLCYLAYTDFKTWQLYKNGRVRDHYSRQLSKAKFKNQGYIWLVNLFCAGTLPPPPHLACLQIWILPKQISDHVRTDLVQSLGWVLSANNLARDSLWPSFACDVQGFFINMGDVGSSIWALVIAVHTVLLLAGTHRTRAWAAEASTSGKLRWIVVVSIWGFVICLGLVGPLIIEPLQPWNGPFCMISVQSDAELTV